MATTDNVIPFPGAPAPWPAKLFEHRPGPTKRRGLSPAARAAGTWIDVYAGTVYSGMVSIDRAGRVTAWSSDWSTILVQPNVETAVAEVRAGRVRNEA